MAIRTSISRILAFTALISAVAIAFVSQTPITPPHPATLDDVWDEQCTISKSTAFEVFDGANAFSTSANDHPNAVRANPNINSTNWEQWEFDGLSHTGLSSVLLVFSRDPSYAFFGQGNLRVEFYIVFGDGTRIEALDYLQESYVIHCPEYTAGVWNSTDRSYSFHVSNDMKHAKLKFDSWKVRGDLTMTSSTPPHLSDGTPYGVNGGNSESTLLAPGLFYALPMAGAAVEVDALLESGRRIAFKGRGGSTRLWATTGWLDLCDGWRNVRAWAGPYTIIYWDMVSRIDKGVKYVSAHLFHDDKLVTASRLGNASKKNDYVIFTDLFDGEVKGKYRDKNTAHHLQFVSPANDKSWEFQVDHMLTHYEFSAGGGFGQTGFTNRVVGGEVGETQYEGKGITEQTLWPLYIEKWKLLIASGAGLLGPRVQQVFIKLVSYLL
ncbi:hypothetical protein IQ06DRAFT_287084 [Phaeosphaeriaceae sp. SRC1lsM3a]|nr:hypothetical protein IQ06DRAFT_287084 [Stagonospora sp. SRC1lsM3a]